MTDYVHLGVIGVYAVMGTITFLAYGFDKKAAKRRRRRTPEATLHALSLLGGWPGAIIGQQVYRHKTKKQPFRTIFWLTVLGNLAILAWLVASGALGSAAG